MVSTTITIGTTPAKLLDLIKGSVVYVGASASKTYAGLANPNGAQTITLQASAANGGSIYLGDDSGVSSINNFAELLGGVSYFDENASGKNGIPVNIWIRGSAAGQLLSVGVRYG